MSKYMINKVLWEIERTERSVAEFIDDPARFVGAWEEADPLPPSPSGGTLTDEERDAVVSGDYGALYRLGAHPFILWQFARAVWVPARMEPEEFAVAYRVAVAQHGYPDFTT